MNVQSYRKPEIKFVSLRNEQQIAATCWGYHGTNTKLYCNIAGTGYCSFQIASGGCELNLVNVIYYDGSGNSSAATSAQISALKSILDASGGSHGQPYSGEGSVVIPDVPSPSWS